MNRVRSACLVLKASILMFLTPLFAHAGIKQCEFCRFISQDGFNIIEFRFV